ncbi:helix-turn-helix domain-containing protein [Baekduia soli]|uniref:Helix-turn-helix domain-containing protein n=1 Tax=Baekduia soli TaxID=496014 RepID=A0A5B8TZM6_9ACTN|nr:helix-turn-helix domain-containing protein [Baekduia soli]QEC46174.1 helix-turn-helix domain-containing protein [Baekduia soli]
MSADPATLALALVDALDDRALDALAERLASRLVGRIPRARHDERPAYTVAALAESLGLSPKAVRNAIGRGELRARKRGARWLITTDAVAKWLEVSPAPAPPRGTSDGPRPHRRRSRAIGPMTRALAAVQTPM